MKKEMYEDTDAWFQGAKILLLRRASQRVHPYAIAVNLNREGFRNEAGDEWTEDSVAEILKQAREEDARHKRDAERK